MEKEGEKDLIEKTVKRRNITSERTRKNFSNENHALTFF